MTKFTLTIDLDNDAFQPDPAEELAYHLRRITNQIAAGYQSAPIIDTNGNTVGSWSIK